MRWFPALIIAVVGIHGTLAAGNTSKSLLSGTWVLVAAEFLQPDGTRSTDPRYGAEARGIFMVDDDGRYSIQIYRPDRPKFTGDKGEGTPEEYQAAATGMSTHMGRIVIDQQHQTLQFKIDNAAYPNWDHTTQIRQYKLDGDELSYQVPATAGAGIVRVSVWRRVKPGH